MKARKSVESLEQNLAETIARNDRGHRQLKTNSCVVVEALQVGDVPRA